MYKLQIVFLSFLLSCLIFPTYFFISCSDPVNSEESVQFIQKNLKISIGECQETPVAEKNFLTENTQSATRCVSVEAFCGKCNEKTSCTITIPQVYDDCDVTADVLYKIDGDSLTISYDKSYGATHCVCASGHRFQIPREFLAKYVHFQNRCYVISGISCSSI